jgi:hypothetical protein
MQDPVRTIADADGGPCLDYGKGGSAGSAINPMRTTGYLFLSDHSMDRTASHVLVVSPCRLQRGRQTFLLRRSRAIDLRCIESDLYQVHLVQDFWSDDTNPDLSECLAGIFLGRRRQSGDWEVPERWPIECRSLDILGLVDTRQGRYVFLPCHAG